LGTTAVTVFSCSCLGHTLFLIRDEDEVDKTAWKKMKKIEIDDLAEFVDKMNG